MKTLLLIPILALTVQLQAFSQLNNKTGWQNEGLNNKPAKITTLCNLLTEKFGEPTEKLVNNEEIIFNSEGGYLSKKIEDLTKSEKNQTLIYQYDGTGKLIQMTDNTTNYKNFGLSSTYSSIFEWNNNLIIRQKVINATGGIQIYCNKIEYEYDNHNKNIMSKSYDSRSNLIEIWEFLYSGANLSERKQYNGDGFLTYNCKMQYDGKGNLIQSDEYNNKNPDISKYFIYDENNNVIKETPIYFNSYQKLSVSEQQKRYFYYNYEYYPNRLIKKSTKFSNSNDKPLDILEFKYDEFGNWVEKIQWDYDLNSYKYIPHLKFVRKISYF